MDADGFVDYMEAVVGQLYYSLNRFRDQNPDLSESSKCIICVSALMRISCSISIASDLSKKDFMEYVGDMYDITSNDFKSFYEERK